MLSEIIQELEQCDSEIERLLQQPRVPRSSFEQVFARQRTALQRFRSLQQAQEELQRAIVLQTTDLFPFVLLKLEAAPVSGERSGSGAIELLLTIQFNFLPRTLAKKPIKVGIQHGWLRLKLEHCTIPLDQQGLIPPLSIAVTKTAASEQTFTGNIGLSLGMERGTGTTITTEYEIPQAFLHADETEPAWEFQSPNGYFLFGVRQKEWLGTIQVDEQTGNPYKVNAVFEIDSPEDLFIYREGALLETRLLEQLRSNEATYKENLYKELTSENPL